MSIGFGKFLKYFFSVCRLKGRFFSGVGMILKLCSKCGKKIEYPKTLCDECQEKQGADFKKGKAKADKRYSQTTDRKLGAFYHTREWKVISATRMQMAGYMCEYCGKVLAIEVHHETPIDTPQGWETRFDISRVRATCIRCHNIQHKRFGARRPDGRNL